MKDQDNIPPALMEDIGARAKAAASELAFAPPAEAKRAALEAAADACWARWAEIIERTSRTWSLAETKG